MGRNTVVPPLSPMEAIADIAKLNSELLEINSQVLTLNQQYSNVKVKMQKLVSNSSLNITIPLFGSSVDSPEESHWEESARCW